MTAPLRLAALRLFALAGIAGRTALHHDEPARPPPGGRFTARVACEMAGTFAAVAPVAGGYSSLDGCPDTTRASVLEIHGTADQVAPYRGHGPERRRGRPW